MKSSPSCNPRRSSRSSLVLASTTALLLAASPDYSDARNLRRSSSSSNADMTVNIVLAEDEGFDTVSSNDYHLIEKLEEDGFEAVGGTFSHSPLFVADDGADSDWHHRSILRDEEKLWEDIEPKEYINDESLAFVDPEEHERNEKSCDDNEKLWTFKFRTDDYGYETWWTLEEEDADSGDWISISSGPPGNSKYHDNTVYQGATCLPGGKMYKLTMGDAYKDGFCCNYGEGTYSYQVDGIEEYNSNRQRSFTDQSVHQFYVGLPIPSDDDGNDGNVNGPFTGRTSVCGQNKQEIRIKLLTDKYGDENTLELRNLDTGRVIVERGLGTYGSGSTDDIAVCVPYGKYQFTMTDGVGDGICCGRQGNGRYEIYMDNELMIYGSDFNYGKRVSHEIIVGYHTKYDQMSQREVQYLQCHNWRRLKYHNKFGAEYVPLKYDMSLAEDANSWAIELLNDCGVNGIEHEPGVEQGENLAKNMGSGKWGQQYPVENICRRWFEREETWDYPANAHFTQGLWRSAHYVGCAESEKTMDNGGTCRVQVCRYARAGNCNMGVYKSTVGDNWKEPMLMTHNPCGPVCPPNGCH
ncbi:hypothetical protein ACHAXR_010017 [Thalassiosira sp. AJA248-18]